MPIVSNSCVVQHNGATYALPHDLLSLLQVAYETDHRVTAIKFLRSHFGIHGLKDGKDILDSIANFYDWKISLKMPVRKEVCHWCKAEISVVEGQAGHCPNCGGN